ncbi:MAG: DEAD/DEAH box helicase [Firmicutes bacterium]|nr:DEAD/DEAH box helicase [Lachnospiraceae bacterium]MDD6066508.1 DEAD/DEAH box helicase [Bacillota bacterium]MDY2818822.1 DEAD/DEAH box helicase [Hominisplanchenecus sp.]
MDTVKFEDLGLDTRILRAITEMGFEEPSPIQAKAIPEVMSGRDVIGQAQTGTGKTAAFGIPLLQKIDPKNRKLQAIVLCPTRELAIQVADEIRRLCKFMHGIKVLPVYGGQDISIQIRSLKGGVQLVIGTPGRVMDHLRRHTLKFDELHTIVLDEADEMLNMGFREDIETILKDAPQERQTILFSATMPQPILDITRNYQKDAVMVRVVKKELTVKNIDQYYYEVKQKNKEEVLSRLIDMYNPKLSLVFCNTKKRVDELTEALKGRGYFAEGLHGDLKQSQRDRVMKGFRTGKTEILIATDVAARGIDVDDVEAVFNYDLPQDDEFYVHRIGRTGRAGRVGKAFTFVVGREVYKLKDIQRYCKTKIYAQPVPSLNDVTAIRLEKVMEEIEEIIKNEDLRSMMRVIERQINEEDYTAMDIAAAFLKKYMGEFEQNTLPKREDDFGDTGAEEGMVRLFINIGKKQKVRPGDILGAVAGESGIPGKLVGTIDMYDKYTFVEVPRENAADVLRAMKNTKIKGKSINVEPANGRM